MEPRNMHVNVAGATPVAQPSPPPPAQPPEPSPLPGPDMPMVLPMEPLAAEAAPVEDSPKAQEIKAELAHLDEIEATLPPHDDDGEDGDEAEHHAGASHKKRRHR